MHKIGIKAYGARIEGNEKALAAFLDEIVAAGFQAVEISPDDSGLLECGQLKKGILWPLKALLSRYDLEITVHVPLRLNLFNREIPEIHERVLYSCLDICSALSASILVFHPGRYIDNVEFARYGKPDPGEVFSEPLMKLERRILRNAAAAYPKITIAMENQRPYADCSPYSYAEYPLELARQVDRIGMDNIGVTLDTGHLNLACAYHRLPLPDALESICRRAVHCHIHDNHGIANYYTDKDKDGMLPFGIGDEHLVPGSGTFPFPDFFRMMDPYDGIYLVELSGRFLYPEKIREAYAAATALMENRCGAMEN